MNILTLQVAFHRRNLSRRAMTKLGILLATISCSLLLYSDHMTKSIHQAYPRKLGRAFEKKMKEMIIEEPLSYNGKDTTMLLGIFSTNIADRFRDRRDALRKTYIGVDDPRFCKLNEYIRQKEADPANSRCLVPYTFIIAGGGYSRPFDHGDDAPLTIHPNDIENEDCEDDCVYLNIRESMQRGKSATFFKFASEVAKRYGIDYIAKVDDDTVVHPDLLLRFMHDDLPPAPLNVRMYGGNTWATREKQIFYGVGPFYFMSNDLADYVGNQLSSEDRAAMSHHNPIEDADMGVFVFSHERPIKYINLASFKFFIHSRTTKRDNGIELVWSTINRRYPARPKDLYPWAFLCNRWKYNMAT